LIRHTATLAKSKADALAEREKYLAKQEAQRLYHGPRYQQFEAAGTGTHMDVDMDSAGEQELGYDNVTTTIKGFLKYENPFLSSLSTHRYIFDAFTTGQVCQVLPSRFELNQLLSGFDVTPNQMKAALLQQTCQSPPNNNFNYPMVMSIQEQINLRNTIRSEIERSRQKLKHLCEGSDENRPAGHIRFHGNENDSHLRNAILIIENVQKEFDLEEKQSRCFYFMAHRLLLTKELLPSLPMIEVMKHHRCMYMGGAGGTGKSQVILAIVELFSPLKSRDTLNIAATTGFAAHRIGGSTIDSLCRLRRMKDKYATIVEYADERLPDMTASDRWTNCQFLILDEVCQITPLQWLTLGLYAGCS